MFCDSWYIQSFVILPFQVEKPKTLVLCTIAENKQLFLYIITDKNARNTWILRKRLILSHACPIAVIIINNIFFRISYPCLQIRASWRESKCGGDVEVLAKELQQLLGQVEQGQHLLVHHLQPHLDPPDVLRLRGLASLRRAFVLLCCFKGSPSWWLPFETPSFVLLNKVSYDDGDDDVMMVMMMRRRRRKRRENIMMNLYPASPKQRCPPHDWDSTASIANLLAGSNWTWASSNIWNSTRAH